MSSPFFSGSAGKDAAWSPPASYSGLRLSSFVLDSGSLSSLTVGNLPAAGPGASSSSLTDLGSDEVVVRVAFASVNPSDVKNALGFMSGSTKLPRVLGRDFSGRVVATGDGPQARALLHQQVFGTGGDLGFTVDGAHAEYLRLPSGGVSLAPSSLAPAEVATVGVAYVTASHGLERGRLQPDDIVLVTGANGAVGSAVIQLAKLKGARVIAIERTNPKSKPPAPAVSTAAGAGVADATIYLSDLANPTDLGSAVRALPLVVSAFASSPAGDPHHRPGASLVFDVVGGSLLPVLLGALSTRGRLVCISMPLPSAPLAIDGLELYRQELELIGVNSLLLTASESASLLRGLVPAFEDGRLAPRDAAITLVRPNNIGQAYADVYAGKARGKIVVDFTGQDQSK